MPISYLFEHGSTGLALQSIREDGSGNKRTNCPVFSWGEGEPRLEELAEFTSKTHVIPFTIRNLPLTFMDHSSEAEEISMTMAHLNHKLV
jgi:hypothetical protein